MVKTDNEPELNKYRSFSCLVFLLFKYITPIDSRTVIQNASPIEPFPSFFSAELIVFYVVTVKAVAIALIVNLILVFAFAPACHCCSLFWLLFGIYTTSRHNITALILAYIYLLF